MTREQCEEMIVDALKLVRKAVHAYDPTIKQVSMAICRSSSWAFSLADNENEENEYLLNVCIFDGEDDSDGTAT